MKAALRKVLLVACTFLAAGLLYIPFRLLAQKYNIVSVSYLSAGDSWISHSDNFYHWFSLLIWPSYSAAAAFFPFFCARWLRLPRYMYVLVSFALLFLWHYVTDLDTLLGIPGGGLIGFQAWSSNNPGINTTLVSVILCPFAAIGGAVLGILLANIKRHQPS